MSIDTALIGFALGLVPATLFFVEALREVAARGRAERRMEIAEARVRAAFNERDAALAAMRAQHEAERQRAEADHARTLEALESAWAHVRARNEFLERALLEAFSPGLARRADPSQPSPVKPIVGPDADDEPDAEDGVEMPPV